MVVGYSVLALMVLVRVHGPLWVFGGTWRPKCCGPVQPGPQVVLHCVVVGVRLCRWRVASWHCPKHTLPCT